MLDTIRTVRRGRHRLVIDPDGREFVIPAGGAGKVDDDDHDDDDDDEADDEDDDQDEDEDDDDEDELGDKGKQALARERAARRKVQRENRKLRKERDRLKRQSSGRDRDRDNDRDRGRDGGRDRDDDSRRDDRRDRDRDLEVAREKAATKAERFALRAGVPEKRVERFVKLIDLDEAVNADGSIDTDELKDLIADELEAFPEFKPAKGDGDDREDHGDAGQGPRRKRKAPVSERVESNLSDVSRRTGIQLAPRD